MRKTRVVNLRTERYTVYIGRPSKWGNPFTIGKHRNRAEVIRKYVQYISRRDDLLSAASTLNGHTLGCFCKPLACHGDILARLADGETIATLQQEYK